MLPPPVPAIAQTICVNGEEVKFTDQLRAEYDALYASCTVNPDREKDLGQALAKVLRGKPRYVAVSTPLGIPWYVTGILHLMECDCNFDCHLHNGDPLTARTVDVPKGRPPKGRPPFTWEQSANDALRFDGFYDWPDWSTAGTLFRFESYNGFGYRSHGVNSAYLFGGTNHYTAGKYVSDGVFSHGAVSKQIGAAIVLKRMTEQSVTLAESAATQ